MNLSSMSLQNILVDHVLPQHQTLALLYLMRYLNDGSNFVNQYQHLRDILDRNNLLYVIYKTVRRYTRNSASENDNGDYHDHRSFSIIVQSTMLHSLESESRVRFLNTETYEMVDGLKALFALQFRIMNYELRDKFLSTEMEEKLLLGKSFGNYVEDSWVPFS